MIGRVAALGAGIGAWASVRRLARLDRSAFEAWQARALARSLRAARDLPAYRDLPARPALADLPVTNKATVMATFHARNRLGLTAEAGWAALARGGRLSGHDVGASTGTSGARGLYLVSDAEKATWLGAMLAKCLPDALRVPHRVAVCLPAASALYRTADLGGRLRVRFLDSRGDWAAPLRAFDPTVVIGPPRVLAALEGVAPARVISAGEVLEPDMAAAIHAATGCVPEQIYMATEGLLATTCAAGRLHLAEDCMAFELEPGPDGLCNPVVTDLRRRVQPMLRYRMNDLLRLDPAPCGCGLPLRVVAAVVGRADDALRRADGSRVAPDRVRAAVQGDGQGGDFRVVQRGATVHVTTAVPDAAARLAALMGEGTVVEARAGPLVDGPGPKLRRVRRES